MKTKLEHRQRTTTKKTTSTSPTVGYWKYLQTTCSQQCHLHSSTTLSSPLAIWTSFDIALLSITSSFPGSWLLATEPANTKVLHHRMRRERQWPLIMDGSSMSYPVIPWLLFSTSSGPSSFSAFIPRLLHSHKLLRLLSFTHVPFLCVMRSQQMPYDLQARELENIFWCRYWCSGDEEMHSVSDFLVGTVSWQSKRPQFRTKVMQR